MAVFTHMLMQRAAAAPVLGFLRAVQAHAGAVWISGENQSPAFGTYVGRWTGSVWDDHTVPLALGATGEGWALAITPPHVRVIDDVHVWLWDGSSWTLDEDMGGGAGSPYAYLALAGDSDSNLYVSGYYLGAPGGGMQPVLQMRHWDGTTWSDVPIAGTGYPDNATHHIHGLALGPTGEVWFAGDTGSGGPFWRGTLSGGPVVGPGNGVLYGVFVAAASDVWMCGQGAGGAEIQRNTGSGWVSLGGFPTTSPVLAGIAGTGSSDVWVCGYVVALHESAVVWHWNGSAWTDHSAALAALHPSAHDLVLEAIAASATNDVWAVGFRVESGDTTLWVVHWDGVAWSDRSPVS